MNIDGKKVVWMNSNNNADVVVLENPNGEDDAKFQVCSITRERSLKYEGAYHYRQSAETAARAVTEEKRVKPIDLNEEACRRTILAVLECVEKGEQLGSITKTEMQALYHRMRYDDFCVKHQIPYEEMTDDDYCNAYKEEDYEIDRR